MKFRKYIVFAIIFTFMTLDHVKALSCSRNVSKDLGTMASHVKINYSVNDKSEKKELIVEDNKTYYTVPNFEFEITVYNLTSDIYVTIQDDVSNASRNIFYSDTEEGNYTFTNSDFGKIYNYTATIYSANSGCYGQKIKTLTFTKPMYNAYSEYTFCQNSSNYYCQKFTTKELKLLSEDDFLRKITVNNARNKEETEEKETIIKIVKNNWKIYLALFMAIPCLAAGIVIVIKIRQKNAGWRL